MHRVPYTPGRSPSPASRYPPPREEARWAYDDNNFEPPLMEDGQFEEFQAFLAFVEMELFDWWKDFVYRGEADSEFIAMLDRDQGGARQPLRPTPLPATHSYEAFSRPTPRSQQPPHQPVNYGYALTDDQRQTRNFPEDHPGAGDQPPFDGYSHRSSQIAQHDQPPFDGYSHRSSQIAQHDQPPFEGYSHRSSQIAQHDQPPFDGYSFGSPQITQHDHSASPKHVDTAPPGPSSMESAVVPQSDQWKHESQSSSGLKSKERSVWNAVLRKKAPGICEVTDYLQSDRTWPVINRVFTQYGATWKKGEINDAYALDARGEVSTPSGGIRACFAILDKHPNLADLGKRQSVMKYCQMLANRAANVVKQQPTEIKFWGIEEIPPDKTQTYKLLAEGATSIFFALVKGDPISIKLTEPGCPELSLTEASLLHYSAPRDVTGWTISNTSMTSRLILLGAM